MEAVKTGTQRSRASCLLTRLCTIGPILDTGRYALPVLRCGSGKLAFLIIDVIIE